MKVKWREGLAWQQLGEEIVIIDSKLNKEVHRLNSLGTFLWQKMNDFVSEQDLCQLVLNDYEITEDALKKDLSSFLTDLKDKQLVEEI